MRLGRWARRRPVFAVWLGMSITLYLAAIGIGLTAKLMTALSNELVVVIPVLVVIMAAMAISVSAQGTALVGAAAGFIAGFLSGGRGRKRGHG